MQKEWAKPLYTFQKTLIIYYYKKTKTEKNVLSLLKCFSLASQENHLKSIIPN